MFRRVVSKFVRNFSTSGSPTLFELIAAKKIPAKIIYEDALAMAFNDISPQAPYHFLVIPKTLNGLTKLSEAQENQKEILGHLLWVVQKVAKDLNLEKGFRVVINNGEEAGFEFI